MVTRVTAAVAASLASGGTEKVGFLNDIVTCMWDHINVAACDLTREIVEPIFREALPGPLSSLRFEKLDLGKVPLKLDNVDVHKRDGGNEVKLDMDVTWDGQCDIDLHCDYLGTFGVESIKLAGRLSIILDPIIDRLPLVGALQVGFANPPKLRIDFTGLAQVAEFALIESTVYKIIDDVMAGICVLPNRIYVKLDPGTAWYDAFQPDLGLLRVTIVRGAGFQVQKQLLKDVPDVYVQARLGARPKHSTEVVSNSTEPEWDDVSDWLLSDHDQELVLNALDSDFSSADDSLGWARISVGNLLLKGCSASLPLVVDNVDTGAKLDVSCKVFDFSTDLGSFTDERFAGPNRVCGVAYVLVARVAHLPVERDDASSYVKVTAFNKPANQTMVIAHNPQVPDMDALNPCYDMGFRYSLTQELAADAPGITLDLMNKKTKLGSISVPFASVTDAPDCTVTHEHELGNGAVMHFRIIVRGVIDPDEV